MEVTLEKLVYESFKEQLTGLSKRLVEVEENVKDV